MDDSEDEAGYSPNPYDMGHQEDYGASEPQKLPAGNTSFPRPVNNQRIGDDVDETDEEEDEMELQEEEEDRNQNNGVQHVGKDMDDDGGEDDDDSEEDDDYDKQKVYSGKDDGVDVERNPKKRKLKSLVSSYEFAPRKPAPPAAAPPSAPKQSFGGRNSLTDWTERETFVLLDAWGDRFLQRGKKSLRSEEWQEVAEKVSEASKIERTDTQCRNRLDTLKKKYKKEKSKLAETGGTSSKWVYFKKMDMLLSSPSQQAGLSLGMDSGEYVFMNPRVYLNRASGLDELKDSPGNSESTDGEDDTDELPPKKRRSGRDGDERSSFRLLANSIQKFSDIYEKIENSKRQQMMELEKMKMDFYRDLEMQKRQIMERAQAEIAKIRQGDDDKNDASADNASG